MARAFGTSPVKQQLVASLLEGVERLEVWLGGTTHVFVTRGFPAAWPPVIEHCGG